MICNLQGIFSHHRKDAGEQADGLLAQTGNRTVQGGKVELTAGPNDNMIFRTAPPAAKTGNITFARPRRAFAVAVAPIAQCPLPIACRQQRNTWPPGARSI